MSEGVLYLQTGVTTIRAGDGQLYTFRGFLLVTKHPLEEVNPHALTKHPVIPHALTSTWEPSYDGNCLDTSIYYLLSSCQCTDIGLVCVLSSGSEGVQV